MCKEATPERSWEERRFQPEGKHNEWGPVGNGGKGVILAEKTKHSQSNLETSNLGEKSREYKSSQWNVRSMWGGWETKSALIKGKGHGNSTINVNLKPGGMGVLKVTLSRTLDDKSGSRNGEGTARHSSKKKNQIGRGGKNCMMLKKGRGLPRLRSKKNPHQDSLWYFGRIDSRTFGPRLQGRFLDQEVKGRGRRKGQTCIRRGNGGRLTRRKEGRICGKFGQGGKSNQGNAKGCKKKKNRVGFHRECGTECRGRNTAKKKIALKKKKMEERVILRSPWPREKRGKLGRKPRK